MIMHLYILYTFLYQVILLYIVILSNINYISDSDYWIILTYFHVKQDFQREKCDMMLKGHQKYK